MTFLKGSGARGAITLATLLAALVAGGCERWLRPADDEGRPTVGEMGEDHSQTGTPGVPEEVEEAEEADEE